MNTTLFDLQMIQFVDALILQTHSGRSLWAAFRQASEPIGEPYRSEWLKLKAAMEKRMNEGEMPRNILNDELRAMSERVPSGALKRVAATFNDPKNDGYPIFTAIEELLKELEAKYQP